jgi:hypothetical protein
VDGLAEAGEQEEALGVVEVAEDEYEGEQDDNVVPVEVGTFDIDTVVGLAVEQEYIVRFVAPRPVLDSIISNGGNMNKTHPIA